MIYAYDQWAQLPVRDLYDTQMMLASINAAKDMYEKGVKEFKEFKDQYKDFYTPIEEHLKAYNDIIGGVYKLVDDIYARGGDPLRNAQDRALVSQAINRLPIGEIAKIKQAAEYRKDYDKAAALLDAEGKFDPELERFAAGEWSPFNTDGSINLWTRRSPIVAKTMQELGDPLFAHLKPHILNKEEVEEKGYKYDPHKIYTGVSMKDARNIVDDNFPQLLNSTYGKYYKHLAEQQLADETGIAPTDEEINARFKKNFINANGQRFTELKEEYDPVYLANLRATLAARNSGGSGSGNSKEPKYTPDWAALMFASSVANTMGTGVYDPKLAYSDFDKVQKNKIVGKTDFSDIVNSTAINNSIDTRQLAYWLGKNTENDGAMPINPSDKKHMLTDYELSKKIKYATPAERTRIKGLPFIGDEEELGLDLAEYAVSTGRVDCVRLKNGRVELFAEVDLLDDENDDCGTRWIPLGIQSNGENDMQMMGLSSEGDFNRQSKGVTTAKGVWSSTYDPVLP